MKKRPPTTERLLGQTKLRIPKHERRPGADMTAAYIREFDQLNHLVPTPYVFRGEVYNDDH